jgi:hypothetical protein
VDDTHAYILTDCDGGNPVSAPGVGDNMPLVAVVLGRWTNLVKVSVALTLQGSNLGEKSTRSHGLLLRIFTGPEDFLQDQNFIRKKKVNTIEQQAFFIP